MQLAVLGGTGLLSGGTMFKAAILGASIAGSMIMNGRKKPVGKLNDVRVSSASYGRGIPYVWGSMRVTGNVFWATDFREVKTYVTQKGKEKSGSKGKLKAKKGKATPVYKYYANFAVGLCAGPMADVVRIWADNNLIYNKLNPKDDDLVGPGFSQRDDDNSGKGAMKSGGGKKGRGGQSGRFKWRFYAGDEHQLPDPYMEKEEGKGKVPGYRDLCYLMFQDFALEDFGNRLPTITAEVVSKVTRKSEVLVFENKTPPASGWRFPTGRTMIDIVRGNLFTTAADNEGKSYIRQWDMETRKESRRLKLEDLFPQTSTHGETGPYGKQIGLTPRQRTWTKEEANDLETFGTTHKGDLVLYRFSGNYGPVLFMDPASGRVVKSWGVAGNILGSPYEGVFVPWGAEPLVGQNESGMHSGYTLVYGAFGEIAVFDDDYNKVGLIQARGFRQMYRQGAIGTKQTLLMVGNTGASNAFDIYAAPLEGMTSRLDPVTGERIYEPFEATDWTLGTWPEVPGSRGTNVMLYEYSYIVGANCVGIIAGPNGGDVYVAKMDINTGKIVWEEKIPDVSWNALQLGGMRSPGTYINTHGWTIETSNRVVKIDFSLEEVVVQPLQQNTTHAQLNQPRYYWSERDAMIGFMTHEGQLTPAIAYQDRKVQSRVDIGQIAKDVAAMVGIEPDRVRTGGIDTQEPLMGYMVEQPTDARSILEELANVYQFDCAETDNQLVFKMRGATPVVTIPEEMLGVVESDIGTDNERLVETIQQQLELPERVTVTYYDPKNDYETGSQYFKRPSKPIPVMTTREHLEVTFNMSLLPDDAKAMAKRILYAAWSERTSQEFRLPRDYLFLDPSDVVSIDLKDGRRIECRITDITLGANLELEVFAVSNLSDSYRHLAKTEPPMGPVRQPTRANHFAHPLLANIPYIEDADQREDMDMGFYWGAGAYKPGYNFGMLQSRYQDTNWQTDGLAQVDAIWGYVFQPVPPPACGWNITDTETEITLLPAFDVNEEEVMFTWESISDSDWPSTDNMIIIGDEIILFKNVVENPDGTVTISHLIRGYRGTSDAAYRHKIDDTWMLFDSSTVHLASDDLEYLHKEQDFVINTGNVLSGIVATRKFALDGGTKRPLPVGRVRRVRNNTANNSILIKWERATRIGGSLKDGSGSVPLNEEREQYQVFILPGPYNAATWNPDDPSLYLHRTEILTRSEYQLTSQVLAAIGLSVRSDLHIVIHQMSASVGWGHPHGLTLPYSLFEDTNG